MLGPGWHHIQLVYQAAGERVVAAVQLHHLRCPGHRTYRVDDRRVLQSLPDRGFGAKLVWERRGVINKGHGWDGCAVCVASRADFWPKYLDLGARCQRLNLLPYEDRQL